MPKLNASHYRVQSFDDGHSVIMFQGNGRSFEISIPTISLMGLAHTLREAAHNSNVPIGRHASNGPRRLTGPEVPALKDTTAGAPKGSQFGVGISADFELISAWFNIPNPQSGGGNTFEIGLSPSDVVIFIEGLSKALEVSRSRPSTDAKPH